MSNIDVADLAATLAQAVSPDVAGSDAANILDGLSLHETRYALLLFANYISELIPVVDPVNMTIHMEEVEIHFQTNLRSLMKGEQP